MLELEFSDDDKARMNDLAVKNQNGLLSKSEGEELLAYAKAGCLLGMLHSRARASSGKRQGLVAPDRTIMEDVLVREISLNEQRGSRYNLS